MCSEMWSELCSSDPRCVPRSVLSNPRCVPRCGPRSVPSHPRCVPRCVPSNPRCACLFLSITILQAPVVRLHSRRCWRLVASVTYAPTTFRNLYMMDDFVGSHGTRCDSAIAKVGRPNAYASHATRARQLQKQLYTTRQVSAHCLANAIFAGMSKLVVSCQRIHNSSPTIAARETSLHQTGSNYKQ